MHTQGNECSSTIATISRAAPMWEQNTCDSQVYILDSACKDWDAPLHAKVDVRKTKNWYSRKLHERLNTSIADYE